MCHIHHTQYSSIETVPVQNIRTIGTFMHFKDLGDTGSMVANAVWVLICSLTNVAM